MSNFLWPHGLYTVHGILQARILEWAAFPFFRVSSQLRDWTQVSHIAGQFFISWATREALSLLGEFAIPLVLCLRSKNLKQWTDQCYSSVLFGKQRKMHPGGVRAGWPKRCKEKWDQRLNFGSSFNMFFLLPLKLPYLNWVSQEGCWFHLRFSLFSSDLPLFYFHRVFPSLSFSHIILDSFPLF